MLAQSIHEVFPLEQPAIYYSPYQRNKHGVPQAARGKLFSTYQYTRKVLKKVGLLPSNTNSTRETGKLSL